MGGLGFSELMIILVIFLLLFGANKIPQLARGMGKGIGEFKKGMREGDEISGDASTPPPSPQVPAAPPPPPPAPRP